MQPGPALQKRSLGIGATPPRVARVNPPALITRLSPGDFLRQNEIRGADNKKAVTIHVKYSIRGHPAFISLQWHPLQIASIDKSGHVGLGLTQPSG